MARTATRTEEPPLATVTSVSGPTLGDLIDSVGVGVLDVLIAPRGVDVVIGEAVIYDTAEAWAGGAGDVLLGVGVDAASHQAVDLVRRAGDAGAAAVVLKARDRSDVDDLVATADAAGIAVLAATPDMVWGQLHALVRTVAAASGVADAGPGKVPVGDLFALANAVADMMGGPVTIEDPRSTVLAYSSLEDHEIDDARRATILGHRVPDEWIQRQQEDGVFRRLYRERGVIRTDYAELGTKPRLATAIRAGDEILGSIWVQEADRPLDEDAEATLQEAARIAALHLLRHRSSADLERGRRAELLRAALDGRVGPETLAPILQAAPTTGVTVIALELVDLDPDDVPAVSVLAERAASMVTLYCESYRRRAAVVAVGPVVYVVVPDTDGGEAGLHALATGICERTAEALHVDLRVGIGASVATISELLASRRDADRVLRALAADPAAGPVATVDTVRPRVVLQYLQELSAADPLLSSGRLEILVEHDARKGTEYVDTLRAFFASLGDIPAAAASQGVHANTFRYRLRRLCEVAAVDLDDPVERLVLQLQLHFLP
jgi:hypothetical protein